MSKLLVTGKNFAKVVGLDLEIFMVITYIVFDEFKSLTGKCVTVNTDATKSEISSVIQVRLIIK